MAVCLGCERITDDLERVVGGSPKGAIFAGSDAALAEGTGAPTVRLRLWTRLVRLAAMVAVSRKTGLPEDFHRPFGGRRRDRMGCMSWR